MSKSCSSVGLNSGQGPPSHQAPHGPSMHSSVPVFGGRGVRVQSPG